MGLPVPPEGSGMKQLPDAPIILPGPKRLTGGTDIKTKRFRRRVL